MTPVFRVHRATLNKCVLGILFEAGDEKQALFAQHAKPSVVDAALVKGDERTLGQGKASYHVAFVGFCRVDGHKSRDVPIMVKESIHFDTAFILAERRPGEQGRTQIDGRSVQAVKLGFEAKLCPGAF